MKIQSHKVPVPVRLELLRRWSNVNPLIVNYHIVSDDNLPYVNRLYEYRNIDTFLKDLDYYSSKYQPIKLHDLLNNLKGNSDLPENSLLITFDDGFREIYDHVAPILKERGISATFFLTKKFIDNKELNFGCTKSLLISKLKQDPSSSKINRIIELLSEKYISGNDLYNCIQSLSIKQRSTFDEIASVVGLDVTEFLETNKPYLTADQIAELINQGFSIGGHSVDHPRYHELSLEDQLYQTLTSVDYLVEKFHIDYRVFAFPHTDRHISKAFFKAISGTIDATFGLPGLIPDNIPFNFQRIGVENGNDSVGRTIKYHYVRRILHDRLNRGYMERN